MFLQVEYFIGLFVGLEEGSLQLMLFEGHGMEKFRNPYQGT